jgi:diaminohydroxyphosphoribosylaminopyrimidine deaminase/5-amino-6-(5-phosphoribosylamino)uracil reductase
MNNASPETLDNGWMDHALEEARKGLGHTSPNPAVGALLVHKNRLIAHGHHHRAGSPHAEIECLLSVKHPVANGSTLYVTLEPCSTSGRTPPCTDAIIAAGVKRVVIGALDSNPAHNGQAVRLLESAGIAVITGVRQPECEALNQAFNKWIVRREPFVIAKCGMSLDGRLTRRTGEPRWITSPASRKHAHQLRTQVDAILIGAETLRADDPQLTVRGFPNAKQPLRVVLSRSANLPPKARLFCDRHADRTRVYFRKSLAYVLRDLGKREITSVLIEGGGQILGEAFAAQLVDKVQFYLAPLFTGGPVPAVGSKGARCTAESARLRNVHYERIGDDICASGYPIYAAPNNLRNVAS